jgi:hypothetical protein
MAQANTRCVKEWAPCNDPPCHPSDPDWNGCHLCIDRAGTAAAIRALVEQVVPYMDEPDWGASSYNCDIELYTDNQRIRAQQLAIAAELDGGAPQPTPTETHND